MSTKLNPGPFDCYAKLADDEPYFVLRAKDPDAPGIVEEWAVRRFWRPGQENNPKIREARECAEAMRAWRLAHLPPAVGPSPAHVSALPCGCDPGANWICERHRRTTGA